MIHFKPIEHHIEDRALTRLCDGMPASDTDISSEDWFALRDARKETTLCADCQDKVNPHDVRSDLYGYDRMSTAHLYSVPVLVAFDAIRNCSHCRRDTDANCKAACEGCGRSAGCNGWPAGEHLPVRVRIGGCFAPDAPDFQEAGELKGDAWTKFCGSSMPGERSEISQGLSE